MLFVRSLQTTTKSWHNTNVLSNSLLGFSVHAPQSFRPSRVFGEVEAESFDAVEAEVKAGQTGDVRESVEVENVVV